jgi:hypothetical protein
LKTDANLKNTGMVAMVYIISKVNVFLARLIRQVNLPRREEMSELKAR